MTRDFHTVGLLSQLSLTCRPDSSWVSTHLGSSASALRFRYHLWVRRGLTIHRGHSSHFTEGTEIPSIDSTCPGDTLHGGEDRLQSSRLPPPKPTLRVAEHMVQAAGSSRARIYLTFFPLRIASQFLDPNMSRALRYFSCLVLECKSVPLLTSSCCCFTQALIVLCPSPRLSGASPSSPPLSSLLDLVLPWFPPHFSDLIWCWLWHSIMFLDFSLWHFPSVSRI